MKDAILPRVTQSFEAWDRALNETLMIHSLLKVVLPTKEIVAAVTHYGALDDEEAGAICEEARGGNRVAQFIVGMALLSTTHRESANTWLRLSAQQGFGPARQELAKIG